MSGDTQTDFGVFHHENLKRVSQGFGIFNGFCSLSILVYFYQLSWYNSRKLNFNRLLVLWATILQLIQDVSISYHRMCDPIIWWDDDSPWIPSRNRTGWQCNASEWFLEQFSGILLQSMILLMVLVVEYVVVYQRMLNVKRILPYWIGFWGAVSITFASLDVFGAYDCDAVYSAGPNKGQRKVSYHCPDTPDARKGTVFPDDPGKDAAYIHKWNQWTPGNVGWRGGVVLRIALSLISLAMALHSLVHLWLSGTTRSKRPQELALVHLVNRMVLYPLVQCITRLPNVAQFKFAGAQNVTTFREGDKDHAERLAAVYIQAVCDTMAGSLMLIVFILVNREVKQLNRRALRRCKELLVWFFCGISSQRPDTTLAIELPSAKSRPTGDLIGAMDEEELMLCVGREEKHTVALVGSVGDESLEEGVMLSGGDGADVVEMVINPLMQQQGPVALSHDDNAFTASMGTGTFSVSGPARTPSSSYLVRPAQPPLGSSHNPPPSPSLSGDP